MDNFSQEEICGRIAQVRLEVAGPRGKAAFAKRLGLSPSTYDYYESNRVPPADILVRISEIGQVDLRWLLTGQAAQEPVRADNPILHRVAQVLARSPQSATPLGAFLDILAQTMKFPAESPQDAGQGTPAAPPPAQTTGETPVVPKTTLQTTAPPLKAEKVQPLPGGPAAAEAKSDGSPALSAQQSWIPVLGRSAAGIAQFWSDEDCQTGLTVLSDVIARHAAWSARQSQPAEAFGEAGRDPVQMIVLRSPREGQTAEFLSAPAVKARYADAFALRIDGESMSPDIRHGDLVILSPSAPAMDGRPAVVQLRRQIGVTCKLYRRQGGRVHLVPINEEFQPQEFPLSEVEWALRVLARVRVSSQ